MAKWDNLRMNKQQLCCGWWCWKASTHCKALSASVEIKHCVLAFGNTFWLYLMKLAECTVHHHTVYSTFKRASNLTRPHWRRFQVARPCARTLASRYGSAFFIDESASTQSTRKRPGQSWLCPDGVHVMWPLWLCLSRQCPRGHEQFGRSRTMEH